MTPDPTLYHYTCSHSIEGIQRSKVVLPHPQPMLGYVALSWWTDLAEPDRDALGLSSVLLSCDRTEVRYQALDTSHIVPFAALASRLRFDPRVISALTYPPAKPRSWWVASVPIQVTRA